MVNLKDIFEASLQPQPSVMNPDSGQFSDQKCKFVSPSLFLVNETPKNSKRDSKIKEKQSDLDDHSFMQPLICSEMFGRP